MAKKPVQVGGLDFASKGEASDYFRSILYRFDIGQRIPEPEATVLEWLLERHSEAADKIGMGVDYFCIRDAIYGTRCFEVVRTDGSKTDFSFKNCVDGHAPTAQTQIFGAMRAAVAGDILDKKRAWFATHGDADGKVACRDSPTRNSKKTGSLSTTTWRWSAWSLRARISARRIRGASKSVTSSLNLPSDRRRKGDRSATCS